ncbi:quinone reductase-like isoform X2 [Ostrea edulis]|uniref:quinone reductase-like isoform X2 n=1 Tax=Ostrea edulis TaxID=37623 RepID=UPI0020958367|nr:quinone reductase-like isoform X2 [Ostrea edulis]
MYRNYLASLARQQAEMGNGDKLKVLLVLGSIRDGRQGIKVANFVRKQLENRNFEVTFYDLLEMNFPMVKQPVHFLGPERSGAPQILLDCEKQIRETDAFVIVSAEYNNSIPGSLKNFLDAFPDGAYGCKPSGVVCYSMVSHLMDWNLSGKLGSGERFRVFRGHMVDIVHLLL